MAAACSIFMVKNFGARHLDRRAVLLDTTKSRSTRPALKNRHNVFKGTTYASRCLVHTRTMSRFRCGESCHAWGMKSELRRFAARSERSQTASSRSTFEEASRL